MRKLVSLCAVLFLLGIALFSRPAAALPPCNCYICEMEPTLRCSFNGIFRSCLDYTDLHCLLSAPDSGLTAPEW
jgi:hypothetical protein